MQKLKKLLLIAVSFMVCLCLTGCIPIINNNVEDLLAAPQVTDVQHNVLKALNEYLGKTATLKYPRQGDNLSPFLFCDLDGDEIDEVVVAYSAIEKTKNVQLALLKQQENGSWKVEHETDGMNTDIDNVVFSKILDNNKPQLIIGYTNLNLSDKYLVMYDYVDGKLEKIYEQSYFQYALADMTADGLYDLVAVSSPVQLGNLQLTLISSNGDRLAHPVIKDINSQFSSCTQFGISKSLWRGRYVVLDGYVSAQAIATEVLYFNGQRFEECIPPEIESIPSVSERNFANLKSLDLDNDGTIEVPIISTDRTGIDTTRFAWVSWYEIDEKQAYQEIFGFADLQTGYFLQLPMRWKDNLYMTEGPESQHWLIRDKETKKINVMVRVLEPGEQLSPSDEQRYVYAETIGNKRLYVCVLNNEHGSVTIYNGVTRLN